MPFFADTKYAKKLADSLGKLSAWKGRPLSRAQSLKIVARWLGSATWEEYVAMKGSALSPLDQDVDDAERYQRREHFISVLCSDGYSRDDAEMVVDEVRPSGAMKNSKPTVHQSASSETILDLLSNAYSVGDFDEAAGLFSLIMDGESAMPDGLLSVLEQYIDLDPRALHHMAIVHISGRVPPNSGKARKLLLEQLKRFPEDDRRGWILSLLGDIASGAYGGTVNPKESLDHYVNATALDVGPAAMNAAIIYDRNPDLNDPAKAEEFYLKAARLGVPEAKTNLALMRARKLPSPQESDTREILALLIQASKEGDNVAEHILAEIGDEAGINVSPSTSQRATPTSGRLPGSKRAAAKSDKLGAWHWRAALSKPGRVWLSDDCSLRVRSEDVSDAPDEIDGRRRSPRVVEFTFAGRDFKARVQTSGNYSEYEEASLNDVHAVLIDGNRTIGVFGGSTIVRRKSWLDEQTFVMVCDCASDEDAQLAMLLMQNGGLDELFGRKRSTLFVHGWEIARDVGIRGLGLRFLSAIIEALKPSYGGFGSIAIGVQPLQFEADDISDIGQYKAACNSLRNYLVQAGGNTGSIEGAKLITQAIPLGGMGEAGLMVGLAMNIR